MAKSLLMYLVIGARYLVIMCRYYCYVIWCCLACSPIDTENATSSHCCTAFFFQLLCCLHSVCTVSPVMGV